MFHMQKIRYVLDALSNFEYNNILLISKKFNVNVFTSFLQRYEKD